MIRLAAILASTLLAQATPSATPTPWPASQWPSPRPNGPRFHEATITQRAQPVWPASLPATTPQLMAMVEVLIGTNGVVEEASIHQSSGYPAADAAAIDAARATIYRPKVVNCRPAEGRYLFKADFTHSLTTTESPAPSPTPTPCAQEAGGIVLDDYPYEGPSKGKPPYYAVVEVRINPDGSVKWARIYKSSGIADYDRQSLDYASHTMRLAKVGADCKPVEGSFFFVNAPRGYTKPLFTPYP